MMINEQKFQNIDDMSCMNHKNLIRAKFRMPSVFFVYTITRICDSTIETMSDICHFRAMVCVVLFDSMIFFFYICMLYLHVTFSLHQKLLF